MQKLVAALLVGFGIFLLGGLVVTFKSEFSTSMRVIGALMAILGGVMCWLGQQQLKKYRDREEGNRSRGRSDKLH